MDSLDEHTSTSDGHPNIDHRWPSLRALQQALHRVQSQGLLRGTVDESSWSGALLWRATPKAGRYLAERRVFAD
jgi:transposase